ncbi:MULTISPECIES: hypothetical protein [Pseudovibrio]|uniref:hypothetical protein n=1 Tax=Stappiaceae TaxID=2821832 RepID=UPI002366B455|nr:MULTISPECIES: hypothetical protein [Pseudovibrio]MDD7912071.1 hypothetical protein [Pseudovibrio exalbescens]MDX5595514.1 hypothetical protein [Pseudovibrio sp. SPO723]
MHGNLFIWLGLAVALSLVATNIMDFSGVARVGLVVLLGMLAVKNYEGKWD